MQAFVFYPEFFDQLLQLYVGLRLYLPAVVELSEVIPERNAYFLYAFVFEEFLYLVGYSRHVQSDEPAGVICSDLHQGYFVHPSFFERRACLSVYPHGSIVL